MISDHSTFVVDLVIQVIHHQIFSLVIVGSLISSMTDCQNLVLAVLLGDEVKIFSVVVDEAGVTGDKNQQGRILRFSQRLPVVKSGERFSLRSL